MTYHGLLTLCKLQFLHGAVLSSKWFYAAAAVVGIGVGCEYVKSHGGSST